MATPSPVHFRTRSVCFLEEDLAAYERALRHAFPDLRILPRDYWGALEKEWWHKGQVTRPLPANLQVPYRESLNTKDDRLLMVWREPPGWSPRWGRHPESGVIVILNAPERMFFFDRIMGRFQRGEREDFDPGRVWGSYHPDDKDQKAFVAKVVRLVTKVATNKLAGFGPGSLTELRPLVSCELWAGPQAIEWCRHDPRRRLGGGCRPLDEVETGLPPLPADPDA